MQQEFLEIEQEEKNKKRRKLVPISLTWIETSIAIDKYRGNCSIFCSFLLLNWRDKKSPNFIFLVREREKKRNSSASVSPGRFFFDRIQASTHIQTSPWSLCIWIFYASQTTTHTAQKNASFLMRFSKKAEK